MVNSRRKGKRGELEFAHYLEAHGIEARRGQQHRGGGDAPDVIHSIDGVHFEVKRVETLRLQEAIDQAAADAGDLVPVVAHKRNRGRWYATLPMDELIRMLRR